MKKGKLRNYLIIAVALSVVAIIAIFVLTMDEGTWGAIRRLNPLVIFIVILLVVLRWLASCLRTHLLVQATGQRIPFWDTSKAVLCGGFAGAVTPYRTASLPVEIYFLTRYSLSAGQATAVVTAGGAISVLFFTIALPPALFFTAWKIKVGIGLKSLFALAGIAAIAFFVFLIYSMREPEKFAAIMQKITPPPLRKKRWFQQAIKGVANWAGDFSSGLQEIIHYKASVIASTFILTAVFMILGILVAPLILWGLGYPELFAKALMAQLAVSCLQPFMAVPGESGLAEVTFAGIFSMFIQKNLVGVVTLAWRFFTFYFTVGVMGIVFILSLRDINQRGEKLNPETLFEDSPVDS